MIDQMISRLVEFLLFRREVADFLHLTKFVRNSLDELNISKSN